jgi:hypothetical protein
MKLDTQCKLVTVIPENVISKIESSFTEEDWNGLDYRKHLANMKDVNSLPIMHNELCFVPSKRNDIIKGIHKMPLYDKYFPLIEPILLELKNHYNYRQYSAFFARLDAGAQIGEHADQGNFLTLCHRIHVPIVTADQVFYKIDGKYFNWKRGEVWEFDNMRRHTSINKSNIKRIHLIINLYNLSDEELER